MEKGDQESKEPEKKDESSSTVTKLLNTGALLKEIDSLQLTISELIPQVESSSIFLQPYATRALECFRRFLNSLGAYRQAIEEYKRFIVVGASDDQDLFSSTYFQFLRLIQNCWDENELERLKPLAERFFKLPSSQHARSFIDLFELGYNRLPGLEEIQALKESLNSHADAVLPDRKRVHTLLSELYEHCSKITGLFFQRKQKYFDIQIYLVGFRSDIEKQAGLISSANNHRRLLQNYFTLHSDESFSDESDLSYMTIIKWMASLPLGQWCTQLYNCRNTRPIISLCKDKSLKLLLENQFHTIQNWSVFDQLSTEEQLDSFLDDFNRFLGVSEGNFLTVAAIRPLQHIIPLVNQPSLTLYLSEIKHYCEIVIKNMEFIQKTSVSLSEMDRLDRGTITRTERLILLFSLVIDQLNHDSALAGDNVKAADYTGQLENYRKALQDTLKKPHVFDTSSPYKR